MQALQLVVWDWNGTILDDTYAVYEATNAHILAAGGREATYGEMLERKIIPFENFYKEQGCDPVALRNTSPFYECYAQKTREAPLHRHVERVLSLLLRRGIRQVILTNMIREHVDHHLDRHAISHYFDELSCSDAHDQVMYRAAKGQRFLQILGNTDPRSVCLIGDTVEEIEIAHSVGCISVAITTGAHPRHRLAAAKPTHLFDSYEPLLALLQ